MPILKQDYPLRHASNTRASAKSTYGERQRQVLGPRDCSDAYQEIQSWPGYAPTPLRRLSGLASRAGLKQLWYKDESGRFGLGSFKALGGAYAVSRILIDAIARSDGAKATTADLLAKRYLDTVSKITVTCATDGNHGRSVAWGASQFGCRCIIYIHATVSDGRKQAIERYGAEVVRTDGNYDDSVRTAAEDAAHHGRVVVSDTSYPGYLEIPRFVMQGYTVIADETIEQLDETPTHIFLQTGVGGFAAAVMSRFWQRLGARRPRIVAVDPDRAACVYESIVAHRPTAVGGDLDTIMAGLACGEVSLLAWEILESGLDDVLTVGDDAAAECMRLLADGVDGDPAVVAGESAVAGLAGALLAREQPDVAGALALDSDSRVLVIGTEGDTDQAVYRQIVGRSAAQVREE